MTRYDLSPKPEVGNLSITVGWDAERATYTAHVRQHLTGPETFHLPAARPQRAPPRRATGRR